MSCESNGGNHHANCNDEYTHAIHAGADHFHDVPKIFHGTVHSRKAGRLSTLFVSNALKSRCGDRFPSRVYPLRNIFRTLTVSLSASTAMCVTDNRAMSANRARLASSSVRERVPRHRARRCACSASGSDTPMLVAARLSAYTTSY